MSVLLETSLGDIVIDLHVNECPKLSMNFIKLCKMKYYNFCTIHNIQKDFMAQTGDPTNTGKGGESIFNLLNAENKQRYFNPDFHPKIKHDKMGVVSMVVTKAKDQQDLKLCGSQFFITLKDNLDYLDGKYAPFGYIAEGLDILHKINDAFCDDKGRPLRDIRIKHTIILEDPFPDPKGMVEPEKSPEPSRELLNTLRVGENEELEPDLPPEQLERIAKQREAQAQALTLEMVGDLPFADVKPPENVLFVCKLNPVTLDEDLELIFSRFGPILSCEIIRDFKTGESLCYAFIEFENQEDCEEAYFKMDNVLIDDRRIHVDFSQSVSKLNKEYFINESKPSNYNNANDKYEIKNTSELPSKGYGMVFDHNSNGDERKRNYERKDIYKNKHRDERFLTDKTDRRNKDDIHERRDRDERYERNERRHRVERHQTSHRDERYERDHRDERRHRDDRRDRDERSYRSSHRSRSPRSKYSSRY